MAALWLLLAVKGFTLVRGSLDVLPPETAPAATEIAAKPGDILTRSPVIGAGAATLVDAVSVDVAGDKRTLAGGTELFPASIGGDSGERLVGRSPTFCEPLKVDAKMAGKAVLGSAAFGIFGGALRTNFYSVLCFVDTDGDGRFESAFHSGAQRKGDWALTPVGPTPFTRRHGQPREGVKEVAIVYMGNAGGRLRFGLQAIGPNTSKDVEERGQIEVSKLPAVLEAQGARIRVLGYDKKSKVARLIVESPMTPGPAAFFVPGTALSALSDPVTPKR
jgi:hypothetical protein